MPKRHTMSEGTKTPFRRELKASVPLELTDVLGFYRRELGKLNWKEESKGAAITADRAVVTFTAPRAPPCSSSAARTVRPACSLMVKNPAAAAKAGIMPKPGQVKVLFGNINAARKRRSRSTTSRSRSRPASASRSRTARCSIWRPASTSTRSRLAGKPMQNDEVELGADEIWGLMIGPGGVLALQAY